MRAAHHDLVQGCKAFQIEPRLARPDDPIAPQLNGSEERFKQSLSGRESERLIASGRRRRSRRRTGSDDSIDAEVSGLAVDRLQPSGRRGVGQSGDPEHRLIGPILKRQGGQRGERTVGDDQAAWGEHAGSIGRLKRETCVSGGGQC